MVENRATRRAGSANYDGQQRTGMRAKDWGGMNRPMAQQREISAGAGQSSKYQILMELGSGGMGQVHLAMSRGPRGFVKLVVLKTLKDELRGHESTYRMFLEEARISARLAHPNLVQTYEVLELESGPTMVLEYVEGQSLASILEDPTQSLSREMHLTILTKVLSGLHAAHELRDFDGTPLHLVHRDISPQNVMLQFDGQVKVLDFGIAKTERSRVATETGILKGKIRYMAPEQLVGDELDRRVDVFAVGIMLWEALSKARIWGELPDGEVMRGLLNDSIPRIAAGSNVPAELVDMCHRAIAVNRDERYQSAGEFQRDLEGYLNRVGALRSAEDLGAYMVEHFESERQRTQRIINDHIHAVEESIRPPRPGGTEEATVFASPKPTESGISASSHRRFSRRTATALAGGVVALCAIVAGSLWLGGVVARPTKSASRSDASAVPEIVPCATGEKSCGRGCVPLDRPEFGCGSAFCQHCQTANATPRCNQRNECDIAVCYQAFDNCDGDAKNGCETNVRIDPDHCGGCGRRCPELPHAVRGCGDVCTIWRCQAGYRDCNGIVADGCETAVTNDRRNCGHCGVVCPGNTACKDGKCGP